MKKALLTISACIMAGISFGQSWNFQWGLGMGSSGDEDEHVQLATDSDDNVYMAIEYEGALSIGGADYPAPASDGRDVLLVKVSPTGEVIWSGNIAGDGSGNAILAGDRVNAIRVDNENNVVVIGNIGMNGAVFGISNGLTDSRNYIIKISSDGDVLWEVYANQDYLNDELTALTSDADGNIYVTGRTDDFAGNTYGIGGTDISSNAITDWTYILAKITSDGAVEYVEELPTAVPTRIQLDSNGDFIIGSQYGDNEVGNYALHKISSSDFSTIWFRENLESGNDEPFGGNLGFHVKADDSIVQFLKTTGQIEYADSDVANCDMFCSMGVMVNIDADGNTVSTHAMEAIIENPELLGISSLNFFPADFKALDDENFYIAGRLAGDVAFSNGYTFQPSDWYLGDFGNPEDAFVIKVDGNLNILEYAAQTGTALQRGQEMAVFANGDVALGGVYKIETFGGLTGNTVFGEDELPGFGNDDYFLTRVTTGTEAPMSIRNEYNDFSFQLFPNPASEFINLRFSVEGGNDTRLEILDITGKIVQTDQIVGTGLIESRVSTDKLNPGIYTLRLITEKSIGTKAFVVSR